MSSLYISPQTEVIVVLMEQTFLSNNTFSKTETFSREYVDPQFD